ncbi:hypothetical protein PPACK8108_LOCUS2710 [Phakopsora pachyrhizi]|uniref:Uncharacterized protein n=1 Tax=Phakopsora pachyrhizi TaxID=170000 RepID=A0AAV0AII7_PHAPC|nr:hypothetical protein PPACK8108_LOCUS2710 [Phakopsora pachyrhizi]
MGVDGLRQEDNPRVDGILERRFNSHSLMAQRELRLKIPKAFSSFWTSSTGVLKNSALSSRRNSNLDLITDEINLLLAEIKREERNISRVDGSSKLSPLEKKRQQSSFYVAQTRAMLCSSTNLQFVEENFEDGEEPRFGQTEQTHESQPKLRLAEQNLTKLDSLDAAKSDLPKARYGQSRFAQS